MVHMQFRTWNKDNREVQPATSVCGRAGIEEWTQTWSKVTCVHCLSKRSPADKTDYHPWGISLLAG